MNAKRETAVPPMKNLRRRSFHTVVLFMPIRHYSRNFSHAC
jgi:hypothetical protein